MSVHVLDNPAWNALISGNQPLSYGNEVAKYFDKDVSPFVGVAEVTESNLSALYEMIHFNGNFALISPKEVPIAKPWQVIQSLNCTQMVFEGDIKLANVSHQLVQLTNDNIPAMLSLVRLTNPGPFAKRTIEFGHYMGIFEDQQLVAMAGQRLNPFRYAEISAVCTHPDHMGKGYAKSLLAYQVKRIQESGNIPFLHVKSENQRAISVYEHIGFSTRKEVVIYTLKK